MVLQSLWDRHRRDTHKPFAEAGQAFESFLQFSHCLLGQADACVVQLVHELNNRMSSIPGHCLGKAQHGLLGIEQAAIPVLLQYTPDSFDRVVLAVIGRIVGQLDRHLKLVHELGDPFHKLGPTAMVLGTIILVDQQCPNMTKSSVDGQPEVPQAVHDEIAGDS